MHDPAGVLSLVLMVALNMYVLLGGADYGGGMWDLLARGPRRAAQQDLIAATLAPIWEANHVWLILVIVLLFAGFAPVFAAVTTALHIPLLILVVGIVARGASFVFRAYQTGSVVVRQRWGMVFAIASVIAPICLGVIVGAVSWGRISIVNGVPTNGFIFPWLGLFPLGVGLLALSLFAYLAAAYLTFEAHGTEVEDDFRARAIVSGMFVAAFALAVFLAARFEAPAVYRGLMEPSLAWLVQGTTAFAAATAFVSLVRRRYATARIAVAIQVSGILWGWGTSQYPWMIQGALTVHGAAAPANVLNALIGAVTVGLFVLIPSLWYLFKVFGHQTSALQRQTRGQTETIAGGKA